MRTFHSPQCDIDPVAKVRKRAPFLPRRCTAYGSGSMPATLRKRPMPPSASTPASKRPRRRPAAKQQLQEDGAEAVETETEPGAAAAALEPAQLSHYFDGGGGGDDQESDDEECGEAGWVPTAPWRPLNVAPSELRLAVTLMSGQSFRWERRLVDHSGSTDPAAAAASWRAQYPADLTELGGLAELDPTLRHVEYVGPIGPHLFVLRETPTDVFYRVASEASAADEARDCLRSYLRIPPVAGASPDPKSLWRGDLDIKSSLADPGLAHRLGRFPGVRLLNLSQVCGC